jgi:hypothetical protein
MYIFTHLCHTYHNTDELLDRQEISEGVQGGMKDVRSRVQDLQREVQALNTILSQLDEPINRSATQLSKVVDHLESERSFFFQIIESMSNKKFRVRTR